MLIKSWNLNQSVLMGKRYIDKALLAKVIQADTSSTTTSSRRHQQYSTELCEAVKVCVRTHFLVFSFLSSALACCSLMMVALT